jgi:hypothetical protein
MASLIKFLKRPHTAVLLAIYLLYCAFICFMEIKHHVFWRDEIRAFSIAKQADSLSDLSSLLQNEGHPALWYVLLKSLYLIFHANWVLPLASILVAMVSAFLWLWFAPFSLFERALFLTGVLPIFEFSVMARNYGISMLLMFLFCTQFEQRFKHPYRTYLPLFFLCFTNAHSTLITGVVTAALFLEVCFKQRKRISDFAGPILVLGTAAWVVWTLHSGTTVSSTALKQSPFDGTALVQAVMQFVQSPGHALVPTFALLSPQYIRLFQTFFIIASSLVLIRKPALLVIYLGIACGLSCFSDLIYSLQLRHQGVFYIFWLSCVWVQRSLISTQEKKWPEKLNGDWFRYPTAAVIILLMSWQSYMGRSALANQFETENSAALLFTDLVDSHPEWRDAVLIGEPDYIMDTIPYYLDNPIYFPRDGHYRKWVLFTREWRVGMTLEELLNTAASIHAGTGKPVLFLIGTQVRWTPGVAGRSIFGCNRYLTWTAPVLDRFSHETRKVGIFPRTTAVDETFSVYEWVGAASPLSH